MATVISTNTRLQVYQKWLRTLQSRSGALPQNNAKPQTDTKRVTLVKVLRALKGVSHGG